MTTEEDIKHMKNTQNQPSRRKRRPSLKNDELLQKTFDIFLESGFERTSIETITATVGIAKRTLYLRYKDKEALFKAALQRAIENWIVPVDRLRAAESDDLEETLQAVGKILVDNLLSPAGLRLLRLTNAESARMPEIGAFNVRVGTEPTIGYLAELFRDRMGRGPEAAPELEEIAMAFINLVVAGPANAVAWGVDLDEAAIDRYTRTSVHLFIFGLQQRLNDGTSPAAISSLSDEIAHLKSLLIQTTKELDAMQLRLDGISRAKR